MAAKFIDISKVEMRFGQFHALSDVNLAVEQGEFVALMGANGSGKSTLVRAATGLRPLAAGRVELFGTALDDFREWHRIGFVPQRATAASGVPASVREVVAAGRLGRRRLFAPLSRADRRAIDDALESATRKLGDAVDAHLRAGMREIEGRIAVTVVNAMGERMIRLELAQKASEASHLVLEGKHKTLELRLGDQIADLDARLTRLMADYTELKFRLASIEQAIDGKHPATIPAPALDHD